jgi:hypothetical protein
MFSQAVDDCKILILRPIYKKSFLVFFSRFVRVGILSFFFTKQYGYQKSHNLMLDPDPHQFADDKPI